MTYHTLPVALQAEARGWSQAPKSEISLERTALQCGSSPHLLWFFSIWSIIMAFHLWKHTHRHGLQVCLSAQDLICCSGVTQKKKTQMQGIRSFWSECVHVYIIVPNVPISHLLGPGWALLERLLCMAKTECARQTTQNMWAAAMEEAQDFLGSYSRTILPQSVRASYMTESHVGVPSNFTRTYTSSRWVQRRKCRCHLRWNKWGVAVFVRFCLQFEHMCAGDARTCDWDCRKIDTYTDVVRACRASSEDISSVDSIPLIFLSPCT